MRRILSMPSVQFLLMYCVPVLAAWGAFHLGERYETAKMLHMAGNDGQAGMDVLAGGLIGAVIAFFLCMFLAYLLIRPYEQ